MKFHFDPAKARSNLRAKFLWLSILFEAKTSDLFQCGERFAERCRLMKDEYNFTKGKRGAILPTKGKTRITIYIDDAILNEFRARAEEAGTGYQTMINDALKEYLAQSAEKPLTESTLRRILHEEFPAMTQYQTSSP